MNNTCINEYAGILSKVLIIARGCCILLKGVTKRRKADARNEIRQPTNQQGIQQIGIQQVSQSAICAQTGGRSTPQYRRGSRNPQYGCRDCTMVLQNGKIAWVQSNTRCTSLEDVCQQIMGNLREPGANIHRQERGGEIKEAGPFAESRPFT